MSDKYTVKAGFILTSGLYKNPHMSAIRETLTNAYDAMVFANKDPNNIEIYYDGDTLTIKDFGVGLKEEDIKDLYVTFFKSTKENDNRVVGRFGLGAKSPFAYTNSFKIESRFSGQKTLYVATNNAGIFKLIKLRSEPTEEADGLTIELPVQDMTDDKIAKVISSTCYCLQFCPKIYNKRLADKVYHFYAYYLCKPVIKHIIRDNIELYVHDIYGGAINLISGNTIERTNSYEIDGVFTVVGQFDVTPSRESIKNVNKVIDNIKTLFKDVLEQTKRLYNTGYQLDSLQTRYTKWWKLFKQHIEDIKEFTGLDHIDFLNKGLYQTFYRYTDIDDNILKYVTREIYKNAYLIVSNKTKELYVYEDRGELIRDLEFSIDNLQKGLLRDGMILPEHISSSLNLSSIKLISPLCFKDQECYDLLCKLFTIYDQVRSKFTEVPKQIYDQLKDKQWLIPYNDDRRCILVDLDELEELSSFETINQGGKHE